MEDGLWNMIARPKATLLEVSSVTLRDAERFIVHFPLSIYNGRVPAKPPTANNRRFSLFQQCLSCFSSLSAEKKDSFFLHVGRIALNLQPKTYKETFFPTLTYAPMYDHFSEQALTGLHRYRNVKFSPPPAR